MMPSILAVLSLVAAGKPAAKPTFPLAAVIIRGDELVIVDVPFKGEQRINLGPLVPLEADLAPDKKHLAFTAWRRLEPSRPPRLFLKALPEGEPREVETSLPGHHRFPRFAAEGKRLTFSAALKEGPHGPTNPLRVHEVVVDGLQVSSVETAPNKCEFRPVGLARGRVAHISTDCHLGFDLVVTDEKGKDTFISSVAGLDSEVAASPDGKSLLFTSRLAGGVGFFLKVGTEKPRLLTTVKSDGTPLQPSFVCPRDLVFQNDKKLWVLNIETGSIRGLDGEGKGASDAGRH